MVLERDLYTKGIGGIVRCVLENAQGYRIFKGAGFVRVSDV